ncbi:MAG: thioredoxin family protein [Candidatus Methanofastidiosia archaeon]
MPCVAAATDSSATVDEALESGKAVLLYFWQVQCPACGSTESIVSYIESTYGEGVIVIRINLGEGEETLRERYSITGTPTIVIFDVRGELVENVVGAKSQTYYINLIEDALDVIEELRESADKFYENANIYYNIEKYVNARQNFMLAMDLYGEIGEVANKILCEIFIQKCDKYLSAEVYMGRANEFYQNEDYAHAKTNYASAKEIYENLADSEMVDYCSSQIEKCELYPSLETTLNNARELMNNRKHVLAKTKLLEAREGYEQLGEEELVAEIDNLILECEDFISASQLFSEGTLALNAKEYELSISKFQEAKVIYVLLGDEEKISLCDQNIAIAQQFLDLQNEATTTPPPSPSIFDNRWILYGGGLLVLAVIFLLLGTTYMYLSRREDVKIGKESHSSAIEKLSQQLDGSIEKEESKPTLVKEMIDKSETLTLQKGETPDSFYAFQKEIIKEKNELLETYVHWLEEFIVTLEEGEPRNYFAYKNKFERLNSFFIRSFSSEEDYLDRDLLKIARGKLDKIQDLLNDIMDLV